VTTCALDALAARGHVSLGVRGSSLGGLLALHAGRVDPRVRAVVALCPARPHGVARGLWHATGDDRVPRGSTFALATQTPSPVRLRMALGGGHRTLQHDPAVPAQTVALLAAHLGAGQLADRSTAN